MRSILLTAALAAVSLPARAQTSVPYIGCPGDGHTGPYTAATGSPKPVNLTPATAGLLAWYEYNGEVGHVGTLGPRGWNCFVTIGSNGCNLYIAQSRSTAPSSWNIGTIAEPQEGHRHPGR